VTGTPIQNSLQDVYGLMKYLKHEPWCSRAFWQRAITSTSTPTAAGNNSTTSTAADEDDSMAIAMDRVRRLLHPLILRRTKETLGDDGKPILTLPPIDSSIVHVTLTQPEREFYTALLDKSQTVFEGLVKAGTASRSWLAIFSLLQRLRQSCDHVALTVKSRFADDAASESGADDIGEEDGLGPSTETAVNKSFLSNLLQKFSSRSGAGPPKSENRPPSSTSADSAAATSNETSTAFISQVAQSISDSVDDGGRIKDECPLCLECPDVTAALLTPCAHVMCLECLRPVLKQSSLKAAESSISRPCRNALNIKDGPCPVCSADVSASHIVTFSRSTSGVVTSQFVADMPMPETTMNVDSIDATVDPKAASARETLVTALRGGESSKLASVKRELDEIWKLDGGSKVLIFSQYLGFLDLLGISLRKDGIPTFRLDGQMSLKERVSALDRFNKAKLAPSSKNDGENDIIAKGSVFLASLKAGGVGINLVAASTVFIIDPWWNAAVEDQCINRIHRIGQKAAVVRVRRFVVSDSVEEKIIRLQEKKKSMASDILDGEDADMSANSKPTLDDFKILLGR